jgi:soluble lytic murein transglycosylase-like protein
VPFFIAMLGAMNLGAFMASRFMAAPPEIEEIIPPESPVLFEGLSSGFLREPEAPDNLVKDSYQNSGSREWVIAFFERICGSRRVAEAILAGAERYAVPPSLAFALSWEESRYHVRAVNRQNRDGSIDRGLFQLNNRSFPKLTEAEFFDPQLNALYGLAHLRVCLDAGGSEVAALAIYNAGAGRVRSGGTPRQTLDYTAKVLSSRRKIDRAFREAWVRHGAAQAALEAAELETFVEEPAPSAGPPRPMLLSPLSP